MCLIPRKGQLTKVAKRDITVFKHLMHTREGLLISPLKGVPYVLGELVKVRVGWRQVPPKKLRVGYMLTQHVEE